MVPEMPARAVGKRGWRGGVGAAPAAPHPALVGGVFLAATVVLGWMAGGGAPLQAFVGAAGLAGLLAVLVRPDWGLIVLVVLALPSSGVMLAVAGTGTPTSRLYPAFI